MREHAFFHRTLLFFSLALASGCAVAMPLVHLRLKISGGLWQYLGGLAILLAVAAIYTKRGPAPKLVNTAMMAFWSALFTNLHMIPMFIAARSRMPYEDAVFARWDDALGFHVPSILAWLNHHVYLLVGINLTYGMLIPAMALAIVIPPMLDRMDVAKRYTIACIVAALISFPICAIVPAAGAWVHYGYPWMRFQAEHTQLINVLRTDQWVSVGFDYRAGLICFPSFHAILALLTGVALWSIPYLRWPAAVLIAAMTVSTVTTGSHYVVDVLSGIVITGISVYAAKAFERLEQRHVAQGHTANGPVAAAA